MRLMYRLLDTHDSPFWCLMLFLGLCAALWEVAVYWEPIAEMMP